MGGRFRCGRPYTCAKERVDGVAESLIIELVELRGNYPETIVSRSVLESCITYFM